MKHPERIAQMQFVAHVREFLPDLLFWHTPNGEERNGHVASTLLQMGVRSGVPDLFFPTLRTFIEFKKPGDTGRESKSQKNVREELLLAGYRCYVYDDWRAAFALIERLASERGDSGG